MYNVIAHNFHEIDGNQQLIGCTLARSHFAFLYNHTLDSPLVFFFAVCSHEAVGSFLASRLSICFYENHWMTCLRCVDLRFILWFVRNVDKSECIWLRSYVAKEKRAKVTCCRHCVCSCVTRTRVYVINLKHELCRRWCDAGTNPESSSMPDRRTFLEFPLLANAQFSHAI